MAEITFKAFLSCSLADGDREVVDFFRQFVCAYDLDPEVYDYQEIGRIPDKVKERIIRSDCLIAIATRRTKIEGTDLWTCADWIHHEIALANAYKKPIAIFVEEGVKIEGLIGMEERRERFNRQHLLASTAKIARFLFNLRAYLESLYRIEKLHIPVLMRHFLHVKEELRSEDIAVTRCEVLMECIADELEATHHSVELEETTPGLSVKPISLDFVCKENPAGVKAEVVVIQNTDAKHMWKIVFSPPLKKGQKVKYAFKRAQRNTRPYTHEELTQRIAQGTYEYKDAICEACEWSISYPTAEFLFEMEFPENYEISNYYPDVRLGELDLKAEGEVQRIREGNMFVAEKIIDKWSLRLHVPKPIQDHTYYIYYEPPRAS